MKNFFLKTGLTLLCLILGLGSAWGETKTWTYTFVSPDAISSNAITVNGATWNVATTAGAGSPTISQGSSYSNYGLKFGSSKSVYFGSVTFSTDYFSGKKVSSVAVNILNNGSKVGTLTAQQGSVSIGSSSQTFGTTWTTLTASGNQGTGGTLSFTYSVQQAFFVNSITVTYEEGEASPRTVTFDAGTNGTCSTSSLTETSAGAGVTLPSCTANTNYTFVGWSTSATPTSADAGAAGATYKPSSDCTLYAYYTYQAPSHTAHFSINGTIDNTKDCTVAEGAAITLPSDLDDINGKKFMGWVSSPIDGTTNEAPDFVTSATMGTSDVTYYAVYATASGSEQTYHLTQNEIKASTAHSSYSDITVNSASGTWTGKAIVNTATGYIQINKNASNYNLCTPEFSAPISKIDIYTTNNTQSGRTFYLRGDNATAQPTSSTIGSASLSEASGSVSIDVKSSQPLNQLYIYSSGAVYISNIDVTCGSASYSGYCTTVDTSTPSISADDVNIAADATSGEIEYSITNAVTGKSLSANTTADWISDIQVTADKVTFTTTANTASTERTADFTLTYDGATDKVVSVTQVGKQGDPEIENFIKTSTLELVVGAPNYDIRNCLNIPNDYDTSTYSITTTINGLTQKDGEYACVYPYIAFSKAGEYTVHVVAAAMPGKYAQTEGNITVTVTDPAPAITTIPALFTKATEVGGTDTDINLTLNNWVVSGVNGKNAYVTDGTNGFIIYQDSHGFTAGDVLNGTVACKVLLYNGAAEIKGLTSSTTGLTVTTGGTITPRTTTIGALENINVGSVITLENVSFDAPNLTDGENTIQPFTSLYSYPNTTFTQGTHYNVTGVYILYKSGSNIIKEILPRSAEDIEEVQAEKYAINIASCENGTVTASLEEAAAGVEVTLTVTPNSGYQLSTLAVTNASTSEEITVTSNKFIMPAAAVNVAATFEEATPSDIIFYESFDTNEGTGGNDDQWSGNIASNTLQFDNTGWDCTSGNGADQCAKFGSSKAQGSATTPALNYAGDATLTFKAGAWNASTEGTTLNISIEGGGSASPTSVSLTKGAWNEFTITLTGLTTTSKIKFVAKNTSNNRFFLDEVTVTKSSITPATEYDITIASDIENGTISASKAKAEEGDNITITTTPTTGYHLASLYYTEEGNATQHPITATDDVYSFTMPAANVTVSATFEEDAKYTVTIETPTNGTLVVKHGDDVVTSGEQFAVGEVLDVTATPAAGYKFRNWQAVDGSTHTYTTTFSYTMGEHNVTIKANFDPADQKYLISWNVNGTVTNQQVDAGSALVAPTMTGKTLGTREFVGWTEDALVKNDTIPTYVTLGNATKDVTYYAVFADREEVTAAVPTSITAYADGNYYIVDKFVVEGITRYYALDGAVNSAGSIIPTDITDAVTLNDGRITIDETNPVIKDAMKYNLANINDEYVLTHLLSGKVIGKGQGEKDNNLSSADSHVNWYHFNANPNDPNTFSLNTTTVEDKEESHALFMQYSTWDSKKQVQVPLPRFRAYAVSNRGAQQEKNAFYSAGYTYFVPATPIALSNFATHEVSVSQYGSTTLCMPEDYVMPEGLTGKIVTANEAVDSKGDGYYTLTFQTKYNAGDVVPAGECLVLSGAQDSYYIAPGETKQTVSDNNLLHGDYVIDTTDSKLRFITTYDEENASSNYYYKLATDKNKENFGWYWGNTTGEPFIMTSNERAYLVIDKGTAGLIRGFALDEFGEEDITTFIEGLTNEEINKSGRIYNLQGQMVNKLQKGINIVNGKKVIR